MIDWQIYTKYGTQVPQKGTGHERAFSSGIPHAAAHIWIWKKENDELYLLFQKAAPKVDYKVGLLDISAAGHIDLNEDEVAAAIRETKEELGISINTDDLYFAGVEHYQRKTEDSHKDELRFVYTVEYRDDMTFTFPDGEVDGVEWIKAKNSEEIVSRNEFKERFVQHTNHYFNIVFSGINGQNLI
ncbi:NUDIX domain-containing protein [Candidatus Saccharibacteria bacterium]|nr:MAG: NUDIX domain-containing protein [Candidatus Saccharibacteria bacterium]